MNYKKISSIVLLIVLIPVFLLSGCNTPGQDFIKAEKLLQYNAEKYNDVEATGTLEDGVRTIHIKASQFYFEQKLIVVNKGERIRLIISVEDVPHGFEIEGFDIPDYDINTVIRKGTPLILEFEADEVGIWQFICSIYCGFGHSTMKGIFVIR